MYSTTIRPLFLIISLAFSAKCIGQTKFASGYIIDNDGKKISCLILNKEWKNNPPKITYKLQENDESVTVSAGDIKGFGINEGVKYVSASLKIDNTALNKRSFSTNSQPEWVEAVLFLKVLQEGPAMLYSYEMAAALLFFFNVNGSPIEQLVYKEYQTPDGKLKANTRYVNQLNASMNCGASYSSLSDMKYKNEKLKRYFSEYNRCMGGTEEEVTKTKIKRRPFNIKPTLGIVSSSFRLKNDLSGYYATYPTSIDPRFGLEFDYMLPFNNRKWEVYLEPVFYQYQKSSTDEETEVSFLSGEAHLGVRHFFYLNKNSKLFLTLGGIANFIEKGQVSFLDGNRSDLDLKTRFHFTIGGGYEFKKLSISVRYSNRSLVSGYVYWNSDFKTLEVYLGYKLFRLYAE